MSERQSFLSRARDRLRNGILDILDITSDVVQRGVGPTLADLTFFKSLRLRLRGEELDKPYSQHPWVYASAKAIAENIAGVPWRIYDGEIKEDNALPDNSDDPMVRLFREVNPWMSRFQLWEATFLYLGLTGECFWILEDRDKDGIPAEILPFGPSVIEPIVSEKSGFIIGFMEREPKPGETPVLFDFDEIIHFRYFDPDNWNRGIAPLDAVSSTVRTDNLCNQYQEALFENGADPGGVLMTDEEITEPDVNRIRVGWEDRHGGPRKAGRLAILAGGLKYEPIEISNREMQFIEQREWHRDEVMAAYKVPKAELSVYESLNFATARVADRGFWQKTLLPKMRYVEDVLRSKLFDGISGNLNGAFDIGTVEALQEQFNEKVDTAGKLVTMGYPINAINKRLQLGIRFTEEYMIVSIKFHGSLRT